MSKGVGGIPKIFNTPEELWDWFIKYLESIKENPLEEIVWVGKDAIEKKKKHYEPPTWRGFEAFLFENNVCVNLDRYRRNTDDSYTEFVGIIRAIGNAMWKKKFFGASVGIYQHQIIAKELGLAEIQKIHNFERPILENGKELPEDD